MEVGRIEFAGIGPVAKIDVEYPGSVVVVGQESLEERISMLEGTLTLAQQTIQEQGKEIAKLWEKFEALERDYDIADEALYSMRRTSEVDF